MNKIFFLIVIFFLASCSTVKEGFSNNKKNNSDEFLVKKKSPLVMPPEYGELPIPKQDNNKADSTNDQIKDLIIKEKEDNGDNSPTSKSFQETLLEKIKNN
tara:strand:+ start:1566 stop:1868 length:303 start_codon:yes stop_codon:yes gene_type:complete